MALIKNIQSDRLLKEAIVLDMGDLGRQADRLLSSARAEAQRITEHARSEADRLIQSADKRGYAEGLERGLAAARETGEREGRVLAVERVAKELEQLMQAWIAALEQWQVDRSAMLADAREDVIRFAFALAQKVVHRLVQTDSTIVRDQLAATLALLSKPTAIEISVNPADRQFAQEVLPGLLASIARCEHASIHDDPTMTRGGCVIATAGGRIDATIQTQLERIAEALVPEQLDSASTAPASDSQKTTES